ncbi:MAG: DNA-directed RNA polymerase subunit omega [Firmicutes bacterium]|nr:DNA-directed RNA polymerase subunit omega [Bacillota bacterium]
MLISPPIDKLIDVVDCKYTLCCVVAKRARTLLDKMPDDFIDSGEKAITYAAQEVYSGKVIPSRD